MSTGWRGHVSYAGSAKSGEKGEGDGWSGTRAVGRVDSLHWRRFDLYVNRRWRPMSASAQPVVLLFHPVVTILEIWCISRQRCLLSCSRGITFDPARFAKS